MATGAAAVPLWKRSNISKWNVTNFRVIDTPYWMTKFTIPGLSHESFDIDSNPKMTSIMHTSVMARIYALNRPDESDKVFLDWSTLTHDRFTFVSSTEYTMSKALYNKEIPKWPLNAKFSLGCVGNSSVCNVIEFFSQDNENEPIWTNVTQLVSVDMKTRKPTPLPDWFKERYKGKGSREKGLVIKGFERPPVTFCHPVYINWSDTDNYKHTNFASYVRFAIDALHAALRHEALNGNKGGTTNGNNDRTWAAEKPLKGISKEIIRGGLKDVQIVYLNESLEGETLHSHVWQEEGQANNIVLCAIERDGGDICHLTLEYYN